MAAWFIGDIMPSDRDYFDAKFDGVEKLLVAQEANLHGYLDAVSIKAGKAYERAETAEKAADAALDTHKDDLMAHGAGATVKVIAATTAMCAGLVAAWKALRP